MKFLKIGGVVFGALVITTLGISASDIFSGNSGSLLGQLVGTVQEGGCPTGMIAVVTSQTFSCVDTYEASANDECPIEVPSHTGQTQDNLNNIDCRAVSKEGQKPWTFIAREQAQVACMRAGKRLPTSAEWYAVALGTPDTEVCNIAGNGVTVTNSSPECRSAVGVYGAIGNVWEWTSDDVIDGMYQGRALPDAGYVKQVASDGIATVTGATTSEQFSSDYFLSAQSGAYGVLRGGFFGSGDDAGVYAVQAKTVPTAATVAIGFRCIL